MAEALRKAIGGVAQGGIRTGRQLIDIVTSGMYSNPLMAFREYIQNAIDSIDVAESEGLLARDEGCVNTVVDSANREVVVEDDGAGLANQEAVGVLCSLGVSTKTMGAQRGFRGIGRLGGLAYCDKLTFETRRSSREGVVVVSWDGSKLRSLIEGERSRLELKPAIRACTTASCRKAASHEGPHFFRVRMSGVQRFHKDELMSVRAIGDYLRHTAPLPFDAELFPFAVELDKHLRPVNGYRCYDILLNGDQLKRPHCGTFVLNPKLSDTIQRVEKLTIKGREGQTIGRGWYAETQCLASIPPREGMRGVRVRQGNMEVGDEYFLADYYTERRFATWHIGEIHLDYSVKTNARRDGFEQSPDYEAFLEQAHALGQHLSRVCRDSSKLRSRLQRAKGLLAQAESILNRPFFIDESHREETEQRASHILRDVEGLNGDGSLPGDVYAWLSRLQDELAEANRDVPYLRDVIDGRSLRHRDRKDLLAKIAKDLLAHHAPDQSPEELVMQLLRPYVKR